MKIRTKLLGILLIISTIVLVAGIFSINRMDLLYDVSHEIGVKNAPLADASMEIKLSTTTAHLWFEEVMTGAEGQDTVKDVWALLDEALWYCDAILKGGKNEEGVFYPVNDHAVEIAVYQVKGDLRKFREIAQLRYDNAFGSKSIEDQGLDDQFDKLFKEFIADTDEAEEMLHHKMEKDSAYMDSIAYNGKIGMIIVTVLSFIFVAFSLYYVSRDILREVGGEPSDIAKIAKQVAIGNLDLEFTAGKMTGVYASIQLMVQNLKNVIDDIVQMSQCLAEGKNKAIAKTEYQGNFIQIKEALEIASAKLIDTKIKNDQETWLKTGLSELNGLLSGNQQIAILAKKVISFLTTYSAGQIGLFYILKESKHRDREPYLEVIASYAYSNKQMNRFSVGEGLVGQAALERKILNFSQNHENCPSIVSSSLANIQPHHVVFFPLLYEGDVKGVIEIGSFKPLSQAQHLFLEQAMPIIGIALNTTESRDKMQVLLEQSQQQAEELEVQSEELRSKNEEMEAQQKELEQTNEELQVQSEELQTQQEELRQANEELSSRTRDLEQQKSEINKKNSELEKSKQLIQTKAKEVELASKYKSEFLANMSHELRTPLNSLLILAQILSENRSGNLTEKQVGYTKTIHSAGSDLLRLINEILDLSKVEAGRIEINIELLTIGDLIEATEHKFKHMAEQKGLAFKILMNGDFPGVLQTDAHRLQQVINNLLSNALKFTEKGSVTLTLFRPTKQIDNLELKTNKILAFSVSDTGIGIPKDKQQVVFEAFQQADGTTSRKFGGTGLGLSISRQLARLLGGDLVLESEENKGSTFTLYLPEEPPEMNTVSSSSIEKYQPVAIPQPLPQIEKIEESSEKTADIAEAFVEEEDYNDDRKNLKPEDKSILIIEDDRKFIDILVNLLHEREFKAIVAEDGSTGLVLAERYNPSAIILDIGLPKMDGWNVMERLKDNPETRHIPVHFMSASDQILNAKRMGAIGYLSKPVDMAQLNEAFKKIEKFIANTNKKVLLVTSSSQKKQQILDLIENDDIEITVISKHSEIKEKLQQSYFDCMIVDTNVKKKVCTTLLKQFTEEGSYHLSNIPIIIYTDRELTHDEEILLKQCENSVTIKSVHSLERLLDETTLFLHQLESNLPKEKQKMLRLVHNKEAILEGQKVMIVDDDIRNTFAMMSFLESKNMEVIVGHNGKEALKLLAEEENSDVAVILMDIMMPEMDGYETMKKIRELSQFRKLPIIALTAKAMKGDKGKCIEAGANDYVPKPVDTDKLLSLMRVWLYR